MDAKDSAFLTKFNKTVETRKKIEQMKSKDREMRYNMMLQKLEEKKEDKQVKMAVNQRPPQYVALPNSNANILNAQNRLKAN